MDIDIKTLIPQRYPMMMVDKLESADGDTCTTRLEIRKDNYFIILDGEMSETGLIEHIAQSSSALAGYQALTAEVKDPPIGLIGEVKRFTCHRRPRVGEKLVTTINFGLSFGEVTIADGETRVGDEVIAEAKLKIFIQPS